MAAATRGERVFVNCPFDAKYIRLFHAIVFTIHDLGFQARHALLDDSSAIRLTRIVDELHNSNYSIHDLSRVEVSGALKLPRFNMPFEAGLAYADHVNSPARRPHHLLLLDSAPYRYQASLSDAAGLDPKIHFGNVNLVISAVRSFLAAKNKTARLPGAKLVSRRHALFFAKLPLKAHAQNLRISEVKSWDYVNDLQGIMTQWISENPP